MNFKKLKELNKIRYLKIKFSNKNKELKNKARKGERRQLLKTILNLFLF